MSTKTDYLEAMHEKRQSVNTRCLTAVIYPNKRIKLIIYIWIQKSGWEKKELATSCLGINENEFTFDYVREEVEKIYNRFPDNQIHELLNLI